jgi:hypothetical protein
MKYSLRSLMIATLILPPLLAVGITLAARFFLEPEPQTLPSPWIGVGNDDVLYFAPGPEFKLSREAAAQKSFEADLEAQRAGLTTSQALAPNRVRNNLAGSDRRGEN